MRIKTETYSKGIVIIFGLMIVILFLKSYLTTYDLEHPNKISESAKDLADKVHTKEVGIDNLQNTITAAEIDVSQNNPTADEKLLKMFRCSDRVLSSQVVQRGRYWALVNWVRAEHGPVRCHETITLTTQADYTFLSNLLPMVERWLAPVSLALYAPGHDLEPTLAAIQRLRSCFPLIKKWATFHAFFHQDHVPKKIPNVTNLPEEVYNCSWAEIDKKINRSILYKEQKKLVYPVNVARNIALDAALTHLVLPLDIELYPSPGLADDVLRLIAKDPPELHRINPYLFSFPEYEIESDQKVPLNKTELQRLVADRKAFPFHANVCSLCHNIPLSDQWAKRPQTKEMEILSVGQRIGAYRAWEAIYIGPRDELPPYDERLSWEGKRDKMAQGYIFCVKEYDFLILNNAFVTHRPGIYVYSHSKERDHVVATTNIFISNVMLPELRILYGWKKGCKV